MEKMGHNLRKDYIIKKDSDVYLVISQFNLKENYSRYQIKLDK